MISIPNLSLFLYEIKCGLGSPSKVPSNPQLNKVCAARRSVNLTTGEVSYFDGKYINNNNIDTLGTTGKFVVGEDFARVQRRSTRFRLQATARRLLPKEQVAQCMHRCGQGGVVVNIAQSTGIASFSGVATCGSVWMCPVCSAKISNSRRNELNTLLGWARNMGYQALLLTLTARHGLDDSLADLLSGMKAAKKRFHQSAAWRACKSELIGHITATETTYGSSGWHVHFHMIVIVDCPSEDLALHKFDLIDDWLAALRPVKRRNTAQQQQQQQVNLEGNGHAFSIQGANAAGDYVGKWGAGEEVALTNTKKTRDGKGQTPWELLAAAEWDPASAALFVEYAKHFKGKQQLVWSVGFKAVLCIIEQTDKQVADAPDADWVQVAIVPKQVWQVIVRRGLQAELLHVAEQGGYEYIDAWLRALQLQIERGT